MSDSRPRPCPSCREVVDADRTLDLGRCPSCETPLGELFRLANDDPARVNSHPNATRE